MRAGIVLNWENAIEREREGEGERCIYGKKGGRREIVEPTYRSTSTRFMLLRLDISRVLLLLLVLLRELVLLVAFAEGVGHVG